MKGYFYPDTNHDDPKIIERFCEMLPRLKDLGVSTVFLEFLFEAVPTDEQLSEHFAMCSGGRRGMTKSYLRILSEARELEMQVVGLSRPGYFELSRAGMAQSQAYRLMGPFDGVAAWVISRNADNRSFVVFLGSGHWPILTQFLPNLIPAFPSVDEEVTQPSEFSDCLRYLYDMIVLADRFSSCVYSSMVIRLVEDGKVIEGILRQYWKDALDVEALMATFQDKVGVPMTLIQLNYLLLMRKKFWLTGAIPPPPLRLRR